MLEGHLDLPLDVKEVGSVLFGRSCRLALALWIAERDKPRFFQSEPPRDLIAPSEAFQELGKLVRLGMLEKESHPGERRVYYVRTDSALWKIITAAAEALNSP
jgi:hypothetical protein